MPLCPLRIFFTGKGHLIMLCNAGLATKLIPTVSDILCIILVARPGGTSLKARYLGGYQRPPGPQSDPRRAWEVYYCKVLSPTKGKK